MRLIYLEEPKLGWRIINLLEEVKETKLREKWILVKIIKSSFNGETPGSSSELACLNWFKQQGWKIEELGNDSKVVEVLFGTN